MLHAVVLVFCASDTSVLLVFSFRVPTLCYFFSSHVFLFGRSSSPRKASREALMYFGLDVVVKLGESRRAFRAKFQNASPF